MQLTRGLQDDKTFSRIVATLIGMLVLSVVGFGAYYYVDRYHTTAAPMVDREIAQAEQMVRNDPSNPATRIGLAGLYMRKGDHAGAIAQYNEALKIDDANQAALSGLGLAFFRSGKLDESAAAFERLVDLTKDSVPLQRTPAMAAVRYYLGQIYVAKGDLARAEEELRLSLSIRRTDADALIALASVVTQQGRPAEAIEIYRYALLLVPTFAEAYEGLATAYEAEGLATEAEYARAMVAYSGGSYEAAVAQLQQVVQAKPDFAEAHYGLGVAYGKKGEVDRAIEELRRALELSPTHEPARIAILEMGGQPPAEAVPAAGH